MLVGWLLSVVGTGAAQTRNLDIRWIDVEGGAATLVVSPSGESLLYDAGHETGDRDAKRIHPVAQAAGLTKIDYFVLSHFVESYTTDPAFDPVASVVVASLGVPGGGNVKTANFYDNDSGGNKDAKITLVTPQAGTYILLVTHNSGKTGGCYRYQASIR